jgi:hypothetical protein
MSLKQAFSYAVRIAHIGLVVAHLVVEWKLLMLLESRVM